MAFSTITEEKQAEMGVSGLADTPQLDTADMQAKFDELGNAAIDALQKLITELEAKTAAVSIGCAAPAGVPAAEENLQSVINAISRLATSASGSAHSHANKAVLDSISEIQKGKYDNLVTLLETITNLDVTTVVSSAASLPTSQAVVAYVTAFDIASKLLQKAYPVGSCYIGYSSPALFLGGSWIEVTDTGISSSYTVWKRIA